MDKDIFINNLESALMVTLFVFAMMLVTDYINMLSRGRLKAIPRGSFFTQYFIAAFLGVIPGCLGAFAVVSFYSRGFLTFGALVSGLIATSGDESFVMFNLFPKEALFIHGLLFIVEREFMIRSAI